MVNDFCKIKNRESFGQEFGILTLYKKWSFPLRIWSHLLKKSLMENFIFRAVWHTQN